MIKFMSIANCEVIEHCWHSIIKNKKSEHICQTLTAWWTMVNHSDNHRKNYTCIFVRNKKGSGYYSVHPHILHPPSHQIKNPNETLVTLSSQQT